MMRIQAEFCISHGDEIRVVSNTVHISDSELVNPRVDDRLTYAYERMSRDLGAEVRLAQEVGNIGSEAHLVTHPHDRRTER